MKIFIKSIIFLLSISISLNTYAVSNCEIEKSTPDFIINYLENNTKILKNIQLSLKGYPNYRETRAVEDFIKAKNETISIFNEIFNFTWYYSYFKYYVTFPISNEVPYPVRRDYELLKRNNESLIQYLKYLDKNMYTDIVLENPCNWIENCEFKNISSKDTVKFLIKNSDNILDLYRLNVIWEDKKYSWENLVLTEQDFKEKLNLYYNTEAINNCSKKEWWFFETIWNKIENIKFLNKDAIWAKQKWIDAWKLLMWETPNIEREIERSKLRQYLSNQWISTESQDILLQNLEKFNNEWFSENNNFIVNTIKQVESEIKKETENFKKYYIDEFLSEDEEVVWINDFRIRKSSAEKSLEIKEKISRLYETEKPFAAIWNNSDSLLRWKILETHINLSESIETLQKNCELAVKLCNRQWGWWSCWQCN